MKNLNLVLLGLILATFTACGGKKSNSDASSNRIIVGSKTNLTPASNSNVLDNQTIDYGNIQTGKFYTKILQYSATKSGTFTLDDQALLTGQCATFGIGVKFFEMLTAEYKIRRYGSTSFESELFTTSGIYLSSGDELNIHLSFKATDNCVNVDMKISSAFY